MQRFDQLRRRRIGLLCGAALAFAAAGPVMAQTQSPDGRTVYAADWFARFAPSNAWDMASQVPGLSVEDGEDVRGFAGAAGNVVINGERPSAKAESLQAILRRIPAAQVVRIEVVPGQLIGGEYRARAQVLNVVLAGDAEGWSGAAEAVARVPYSGEVAPSLALSALRRKGATSLNLAAAYDAQRLPDEGYDLLTERPSGALIERRDKTNRYFQEEGTLAANWAWEPAPGRAVHLNANAWSWTNPLDHVARISGPSVARVDTLTQDPERLGFELGGDVSRPLAGGTLKLVGLARRERYEALETQLRHTTSGDLLGGIEQTTDNLYGESVARATWSRDGLWGWSIETGAEVAFNSLDGDVDVWTVDALAARTAVDLPVSTVLVEELRGEAFVSGGRNLTPTLAFDWGAAVETSTLTVSGDAASERTLTFFKPRASLEWRPNGDWRARVAAGRTVAQLNFDDFVSGVEIANDRQNGGNAALEPERTWRLTGEVERKVLGDGTVRLALHSDWVEMVQDRVPITVTPPLPDLPYVTDGPGNLGDGRRLVLEAVAGLPLDRFGVAGGRFNARWTLQHSEVRDPYTGRDRYFSGEEPWAFHADFRQDLRGRNLAWGVMYDVEGELPQYRLNEIDVFNPENLWFRVFVEARPNTRTTVTLAANNVADRAIIRDRMMYDPNRFSPEPYRNELRWRRQGVTWELRLKRTFG